MTWYIHGADRLAKFKPKYDQTHVVDLGSLKDFKASVNFQPGDDMVTYPFDLVFGSIGSISAIYISDYLNLRISENDPVYSFVPQGVMTVTDSVGFARLIVEGKEQDRPVLKKIWEGGHGGPIEDPHPNPPAEHNWPDPELLICGCEPDVHVTHVVEEYMNWNMTAMSNTTISDVSHYLYDHLGNTQVTFKFTSVAPKHSYEIVTLHRYDPYGNLLNPFIQEDEKYLTTQHERDAETGLDYRGARFYDSEVGRFLSVDPLAVKYPMLTPFSYVGGMVSIAVDADGRDIIILSAPNSVGGLGHAAVLIGNEISGYYYYSKNGTYSSSGASGPSNKHPEIGIHFNSLSDFATYRNFNESDGTVEYTQAFRIFSSEAQDIEMRAAAIGAVSSWYAVAGNSCIDVCSDALTAGGFNPGSSTTVDGRGMNHTSMDAVPNMRYLAIVANNQDEEGINKDVSSLIVPTAEYIMPHQSPEAIKKREEAKELEKQYQRVVTIGTKGLIHMIQNSKPK